MVVAKEPEGDINVTATSSSGSNRSWREWRELQLTTYCPIPLTVIFFKYATDSSTAVNFRGPRRGAAASWILGERSQAVSYVAVAIYGSTWPWALCGSVELHE